MGVVDVNGGGREDGEDDGGCWIEEGAEGEVGHADSCLRAVGHYRAGEWEG